MSRTIKDISDDPKSHPCKSMRRQNKVLKEKIRRAKKRKERQEVKRDLNI